MPQEMGIRKNESRKNQKSHTINWTKKRGNGNRGLQSDTREADPCDPMDSNKVPEEGRDDVAILIGQILLRQIKKQEKSQR